MSEDDNISADDLKKMLAEARSRERAATERAARAERERDTAASTVADAADGTFAAAQAAVASRRAAAENALEAARRKLKEAGEAGDWESVARVQDEIASAVYDAGRARDYSAWLNAQKETKTARPGDKYSQVGIVGLLDSERDFLERHPQVLSDPKFREKIIGASGVANAEGHDRGTDSYFRRIEEISGLRRQRNDNEITLSRDEVEVAEALYGNPGSSDFIANRAERFKKYARNREALRAKGML